MDKKERKMRLENHVAYFDLVDTIKEMSLNALDQNLSVSDIISVLDRVKVVLLQQEVMVIMDETKNSESDEDSDDGSDDDMKEMAIGVPQEGLASVPFVDPVEATRGMYS
ncbi:hypothetical protein KAW18_02395 [candidate division WOR-3 bacterium]|nr:hypothetical protein [candidate division WOR-3 bacterium]